MTRKEDDNQWQLMLGPDTHVTVEIQANKGCFPPQKQSCFVKQRQVLSVAACSATQQLNAAALMTFAPGENLSFDERGVACR